MTEYLSKSEKKRQHKHGEEIAAALVALSSVELARLDCSEALKAEIKIAQECKGGARKRQIKYVAKVMRQEPLEPIYQFLEGRKGSQLRTKQQFHEAERLRDGVVNEAMASWQEALHDQIEWEPGWTSEQIPLLLDALPGIQEKELRRAIYSYVKSRNRRYLREVFRIIKAAMDRKETTARLKG